MMHIKRHASSGPHHVSGGFSAGKDLALSGAGMRRLQAERGEDPCFGTEMRFQCTRLDCDLACRCTGGLVAHWKR